MMKKMMKNRWKSMIFVKNHQFLSKIHHFYRFFHFFHIVSLDTCYLKNTIFDKNQCFSLKQPFYLFWKLFIFCYYFLYFFKNIEKFTKKWKISQKIEKLMKIDDFCQNHRFLSKIINFWQKSLIFIDFCRFLSIFSPRSLDICYCKNPIFDKNRCFSENTEYLVPRYLLLFLWFFRHYSVRMLKIYFS